MDERLQEHLRAVARRYRLLRLWRSLAVVWLVAAVLGGILLWLKTRTAWPIESDVSVLAAGVVLLAVAMASIAVLSFRDPRWAAHRIERRFPDLEERLITAITQRPHARSG